MFITFLILHFRSDFVCIFFLSFILLTENLICTAFKLETTLHTPPMIDLKLQPLLTAGLLYSDIAHGTNSVSKLGTHDSESEHHLVI